MEALERLGFTGFVSNKSFLPFVFGGPEETQTLDLSDANRALSQLSYKPKYSYIKTFQTNDLKRLLKAGNVTRTHDLLITNQLLYRLSYASKLYFNSINNIPCFNKIIKFFFAASIKDHGIFNAIVFYAFMPPTAA